MKTQPTDIDREAASLFEPAPGMRVAYRSIFHGRAKMEWCRVRDGRNCIYGGVDGIDTDDPATVGCMLAQVEERGGGVIWTQPHWRVSIPDDAPYHGKTTATIIGRSWSVMTIDGVVGDGPTEGAALVAVMRKLKGVKR